MKMTSTQLRLSPGSSFLSYFSCILYNPFNLPIHRTAHTIDSRLRSRLRPLDEADLQAEICLTLVLMPGMASPAVEKAIMILTEDDRGIAL